MEKGKKKRKKNEIVRNLIQVDWFKFFMKKRKMPGRSEIIIRTHVVEITLEFKTSPERNILLTPGNSDSNFTRRRNRPPPIHRCIAVSVPGGVLLEILGGCVLPGSSNPDPISDQQM